MASAALAEAAGAIRRAQRVLVLTGAGVSAESGIPTFRGQGGLWEGFRAEDLATPEAFQRDPARVWRWYRWRRAIYGGCEPNPAHAVIARMEPRFPEFLLATQNVDGLHRRAGSRRLIEIHGTIDVMRCSVCSERAPWPDDAVPDADPVPRCNHCGGAMRPHILWFGETYWPGVLEHCQRFAGEADVVLVAGTSATVWPPAALALHGKRSGAFLIDINPEPTPISEVADVHLRGSAGALLPALWDRCSRP
ncbi:MAG: NAD-dependent protein deacylase [Deltaproteobacteria bacterium]|nr:NAD-dependent protein deacylase [Deltaproteobacteria bacterium]MCB9787430.1 NAD-dependent protein deacylase [Deltaproteobacteria bacterium]